MSNNLDDWGFSNEEPEKNKSKTSTKKKITLGVLGVLLASSIGFWVLKPNPMVVEETKQEKNYNDLTSKGNNYGYPDNVQIPTNVEKFIEDSGDVSKEGSEQMKQVLEDVRDSVVEKERDWDVTQLGSRKYLDVRLPSNMERVLLQEGSPLRMVLDNTEYYGMSRQVPDGFYLIMNPLDEAQMYLKKEYYEKVKESTNGYYLVYINDVSQYSLPEMLLAKLGYGNVEKFYPVEERLKIKDYPMVVRIKDGNVVSKKSNVTSLGGL